MDIGDLTGKFKIDGVEQAFRQADQQTTGFVTRVSQKLTGQSLFKGLLYGPQSGESVFRQLEKDASSSVGRMTAVFQAGTSSFLKGFAGGFGFSGIFSMIEKAGAGLADMVKGGVALSQQIERSTVLFTTFTGSAKGASDHVRDLQKFSMETGIELPQLLTASERLQVFGFNTKQVTGLLHAAADQAAVFGNSSGTFDRIAQALGMMAEKGAVANRQITMLERQGVPAMKYLAAATGLSVKELKELENAGKLKGDVAARLIGEGIERRYGGQAQKLAQTTGYGLQDATTNALALQAARGTRSLTEEIKMAYADAFSSLSGDGAGAFADNINKFTGGVFSFINTSIKALATGDFKGLLEGIGKDAVDSLWGGFTSVGGKLLDAGKQAGNYLESGVRNALDQHSPSKVMFDLGFDAGASLNAGFMAALKGGKDGGVDSTLKEFLERASQDPRVKAMFEALRIAEGGRPDVVVGGKRFDTNNPAHPGSYGMGMMGPKGWSTAAGDWQITQTNWKKIAPILGLKNFGDEHQQMLAALYLYNQTGGLGALLGGNMQGAFAGTQPWAASPFSDLPGGKRKDFAQLYQRLLSQVGAITQGTVPQAGGDLGGGEGLFRRQMAGGTFGGHIPTRGDASVYGDQYFPSGTWGVGRPVWPQLSGGDFGGGEGLFRKVSRNNPLPVEVINAASNAVGVMPDVSPDLYSGIRANPANDPERAALRAQLNLPSPTYAQSKFLGGSANLPLPDVGAFAITLRDVKNILPDVVDGFKGMSAGAIELEIGLPPVMDNLAKFGGISRSIAQLPSDIQKANRATLVDTKSLSEQLDELSSKIPSLKHQLKDILIDIPAGAGAVFGDAVRQWDGSFKGLFSSIGLGFADMLKQMSAQLIESAVTKFLTSLLGSVIGGLFSGGSNLTSTHSFGEIFGGSHAMGGFISASSGGKLIRVAEGGFSEMVLSTNPALRERTSSLLADFMERTNIAPKFAIGGWSDESWKSSNLYDRSDDSFAPDVNLVPNFSSNNNQYNSAPQIHHHHYDIKIQANNRGGYIQPKDQQDIVSRLADELTKRQH
jgi:tape measure domain-containing protein